MNAKPETNQNLPCGLEIGSDFTITKQNPRPSSVGGIWVMGKLNGHKFLALVFPEHAECEEYELSRSRISKLWVQRIQDTTEVAVFDRGWGCQPKSATAQAIVDFLAAGLAEHVYGK